MLRIIEITTHEQVNWGVTVVVAVLAGIAMLLLIFLGMLVMYDEDITDPQYRRHRRVACAIVVATICVIVSNFQLKTTKEDIRVLDSSEYNLHVTKDKSKLYLSNPDGRDIRFELGDTSYTTRATALNVKSHDGVTYTIEAPVPNQSGVSDIKQIEVVFNTADYKIQHD
jgi:hypothetical protein|nr:MAG TPA: hypothetical protein [Caudoviricetes sp.]